MDLRALLRSVALPLHPAPLLLVGIFALLLRFAIQAGPVGIPVFAIVGSWFLKYGFMLLDHAAQGRPGAPVLSVEAANPFGEVRPLAWGALIVVFYAASGLLGELLGAAVASALRLLALATLPAIVAAHTITGSWPESLNPRTVFETTRRLGVGYLLIGCTTAVCGWLGHTIVLGGGHLSVLARIALLMLLWLELFALLGAVIHQRRFQLGFEPEHSTERTQHRRISQLERERDRFIDQVFAEYRSGALQDAWSTVERRAAASPDPSAEYGWIYQRTASWPNARLASRIAGELLTRLLAANRNAEALQLIRSHLLADPAFRPARATELLRLAELARDGGDRPLARALLSDFEQRFPGDSSTLRARRMAEQLAR